MSLLTLTDKDLFEASYVASDSVFSRAPSFRSGRANPIIVENIVLDNARELLLNVPLRKIRPIYEIHNDIDPERYFIDHSFVEVAVDLRGVEYLGIWSDDEIHIAYVQTKLLLPKDGPRLFED